MRLAHAQAAGLAVDTDGLAVDTEELAVDTEKLAVDDERSPKPRTAESHVARSTHPHERSTQ